MTSKLQGYCHGTAKAAVHSQELTEIVSSWICLCDIVIIIIIVNVQRQCGLIALSTSKKKIDVELNSVARMITSARTSTTPVAWLRLLNIFTPLELLRSEKKAKDIRKI